LIPDLRIDVAGLVVGPVQISECELIVLQKKKVPLVVVLRDADQQQAAADALVFVLVVGGQVGELDRVEDADAVGVVARVVLVAEERGDVAVDELVVDLALEEHVANELPEPDAGLPLGQVNVDRGEVVAPLVCTGGGV
jgi:hypothetical protein